MYELVLGGIRILGDGIDLRLILRYHGIRRYGCIQTIKKFKYRTAPVPHPYSTFSELNRAAHAQFGSVRYASIQCGTWCGAVRQCFRIFPVSLYPRLLRIINNAHQAFRTAGRCWRSPAIRVPTQRPSFHEGNLVWACKYSRFRTLGYSCLQEAPATNLSYNYG